jgi:hypothetical protein
MPGGSAPNAKTGTRTGTPGWPYPPGVRCRGTTITAKPEFQDQPRAGNDPGRWDLFWAEFDWTGWFKPTIDQAKAYGCNTILVFGGWNGLPAGSNLFSEATYFARLSQTFDYIRAQGMYAKFCVGDRGQWSQTGSNPQLVGAQYQAHVISLAQNVLTNYHGTLVMLDVENEVSHHCIEGSNQTPVFSWASILADYDAIRIGVKAVCPWLPMTMSNANDPSLAGFTTTTFIPALATRIDYWDWHIYSADPAANYFAPCYAALAVPALIGEWGVKQTQSGAVRVARVNAILENVVARDSRCIGAIQWAAFDQENAAHPDSPVGDEKWGLWDNPTTLTYRNDVGDVFNTFPKVG